MKPIVYEDNNIKYQCLIWIIKTYTYLKNNNINNIFFLKNIFKINKNFIYRRKHEVYFNSKNKYFFILENISDICYISIIKSYIQDLFNVIHQDDINKINLDDAKKIILSNILKYCSPPLNININIDDINFICDILD